MLRKEQILLVGFLGGSMAFAQSILRQPVDTNAVTSVHTTLGHISILSLPERITRVAAGSDAMQIEWHDNNVFIKPLKAGQSTNLMVWTEHQMSTYELEAPGDVKQMSFLIDETATPLPQKEKEREAAEAATREEKQRVTDSVIGTTMLAASPVVSREIPPAKDYVSVQIKEVVRNGSSVYVRFAVTNSGPYPYRVIPPNVFAITPTKNEQLVSALRDTQISDKTANQFQARQTEHVQVRGTALPKQDVAPGATVEGVLALDRPEGEQAGVYQFVFGNDGTHRIQATAVL
ncbi:MAG: TrbG/VirB9 family P-type conjugative transfer protein [Silvibacterium sp.]|nr:TrbG/VirB9 family P-type conjugative transfer protein [Silvibacterium sp.]